MRNRKKLVVALGAIVITLTLGSVAYFKLPRLRHRVIYLKAVFSPDGQSVVYLRRDLKAWIDPVTILDFQMFFEPSKTVRLKEDSITVRRLPIAGRESTVIAALPPTPWAGKTYKAKPSHFERPLYAELAWDASKRLRWRVRFGQFDHIAPGTQSTDERPSWHDYTSIDWWDGDMRQRFYGQLEVIVPYRTGLLLMDHSNRRMRVLEGNASRPGYDDESKRGWTFAELLRWSVIEDAKRQERGEAIDRIAEELEEKFVKAGHDRLTARHLATREMGDRGLGPRIRTAKAVKVATVPAGSRVHALDEDALDSLDWHFRDALLHPGVEYYPAIDEFPHSTDPRAVELHSSLGGGFYGGAEAYVQLHGVLYRLRYDDTRVSTEPDYRPQVSR